MAVRGAKTLRRRLAGIVARLPGAAAIELQNQAQELRGRAIAVAPELTRRLILSSSVGKRDTKKSAARSVNFDTPYAVIRHEGTYQLGPISRTKAPTQDGPPGRKYLERPFRNMVQEIERGLGRLPISVARQIIRENPDSEG